MNTVTIMHSTFYTKCKVIEVYKCQSAENFPHNTHAEPLAKYTDDGQFCPS